MDNRYEQWREGFAICCGEKPIVKSCDPLVTSTYFVFCKKCKRQLESEYLVSMREQWNKELQ